MFSIFSFHLILIVKLYLNWETLGLKLLAVGRFSNPTYGEVIFVPGSGCNPGLGTRERLLSASEYFKADARPVFLSIGTCYMHERQEFLQFIDSIGIDTAYVTWDTTSISTEQNVAALIRFMQLSGFKSLVACTSPFHQ